MRRSIGQLTCVAAGLLAVLVALPAQRQLLLLLGILFIAGAAIDAISCTRDMEQLAKSLHNSSAKKSGCRHPVGKCLEESFHKNQTELKAQYTASAVDNQSRINALQSQINPHFLYNTLECIRSEALLQGCANIAQMSRALAAFFRYSISDKENIVTVRDEMNNIKNYFLIQKFRFDNRFNFKMDTEGEEDDVLDCLIPKMTIQPVVENCIFHGLEPKLGDGTVVIHMRRTEEILVITISDDGVGISQEGLLQMREKIQGEATEKEAPPAKGNGIALRNVNQRIKLAFGLAYGIQIYSAPGMGTDVEIVVPQIKKRDKLQLK